MDWPCILPGSQEWCPGCVDTHSLLLSCLLPFIFIPLAGRKEKISPETKYDPTGHRSTCALEERSQQELLGDTCAYAADVKGFTFPFSMAMCPTILCRDLATCDEDWMVRRSSATVLLESKQENAAKRNDDLTRLPSSPHHAHDPTKRIQQRCLPLVESVRARWLCDLPWLSAPGQASR